jgi:hypothetical protein
MRKRFRPASAQLARRQPDALAELLGEQRRPDGMLDGKAEAQVRRHRDDTGQLGDPDARRELGLPRGPLHGREFDAERVVRTTASGV